ncbi:MAG: oligosaccharide flippase family protein, partial [Candidatus Aenigmarchaeota archaeon]|nr:oligosaccharide flippase family protein [Candidatus Aenigmarchaeota archaeon]
MKISKYTERSLRTVAKGAGLFFVALLISRALGYLTRMVIARYYGPSGYGLVYFGASVIGLFGVVCTFGLPFALERFIPEYRVKKQWAKIKGAITGSLKVVLFLSIIFGALIFVFAPQISILFFNNYSLTNILRIFSFSLP